MKKRRSVQPRRPGPGRPGRSGPRPGVDQADDLIGHLLFGGARHLLPLGRDQVAASILALRHDVHPVAFAAGPLAHVDLGLDRVAAFSRSNQPPMPGAPSSAWSTSSRSSADATNQHGAHSLRVPQIPFAPGAGPPDHRPTARPANPRRAGKRRSSRSIFRTGRQTAEAIARESYMADPKVIKHEVGGRGDERSQTSRLFSPERSI